MRAEAKQIAGRQKIKQAAVTNQFAVEVGTEGGSRLAVGEAAEGT